MIRFDPKNSVDKMIFMKAMQHSGVPKQWGNLGETRGEGNQHLILSALKEIEQNNEKTAVGLVNALFLSSNSHALDKVCLNIFSKLGDSQSLELMYKKYPTPETLSLSLLPYYIRAIGFLGGEKEIDLLARVTNTFWGLYRNEMITALEQIARRSGNIGITDASVSALQKLYDAGDELEKQRILELSRDLSHELLVRINLAGLYSDCSSIRKIAISVLGCNGSALARNELARALRRETDDRLLEEYDKWLIQNNGKEKPS